MNLNQCENCGRQLTDSESIARGFGPDCAAKRATFLTSASTSEGELATLATTCAASAQWIRNFKQDMRAGRLRQARQCIEAARRKAADAREQAVIAASTLPEPAIVVRQSDRGYRVHPPYRHAQFVAAFKRTVGSAWYPESQEWFIPGTCLDWAKELLEYWFSMPVHIENAGQ